MNEINTSTTDSTANNDVSVISLHDIIRITILNWYWFVISIAVCLTVGYLYVASTPKIYNRTATILVKDSRKGGDTDLASFSDMAGLTARRNVDNEIYVLQSRRLMCDVVQKLNLNISYTIKSGLRTRELYNESPILVLFANETQSLSCSFVVEPQANDKVKLTDFNSKFTSEEQQTQVIEAQYGDTIATPVGKLAIMPTAYLDKEYTGKVITVRKSSIDATASYYRNAVNSNVVNKQASIINITLKDRVPKRAEDVINTLIDTYNNDAVMEKRRVAVATSDFINERLGIITKELRDVDANIESFKTDNKMYDIQSEVTRSMTESSKYKVDGLSVDNQIRMAEFLKQYLLNENNINVLIPASISISNANIASQISDYNEAVLLRERLLKNSTTNPVVTELNTQLASIRASIVASLESQISTLKIQLAAIRREESLANNKISSVPSQEKQILSIARQQKIKEELYLYLLNKSEENSLSMVVTENSARILDPAFGSNIPVAPRTPLILLICIILGIAIPYGFFYIREMLDMTVRSRRDIENNLSAPFLGDIPMHNGDVSKGIAVRENGRDSISEAFRILVTNIGFMNIGDKANQVLMATSSNPGSGKTFISLNLAVTLAMSDKKVLIVDLDLRRRTLSTQLGNRHNTLGVSSYISSPTLELKDIIVKSSLHKNLDVMYAGPQPPNPTAMLTSKKIDEMFAVLRQMYDYIIVDSVPAMSIADAMIIDRLVDMSIYIIREGMLDRRQLPDIERLTQEKKFKNMCIVLNGTSQRSKGYGYGYDYGYGYSYDDQTQQKSSLKKRIRKYIKL